MKKALSVTNSGFSLVEVVLSGSLFALLLSAFVGALVFGSENTRLGGERVRAAFLAEEGLEAVRSIRDGRFADLRDGVHGLAITSRGWEFSGTEDGTGIFRRQVSIAPVDISTKQVTASVFWPATPGRSGAISMATYLTHWLLGDWRSPAGEGSANPSGGENGLKIQSQGDYAYLVRNGGSPDFAVIDVRDPLNYRLAGSLSLAGAPRNLAISGNYAYVAGAEDSQELQIVDIRDPENLSLAGSYNAPGIADGSSVAVRGNFTYLVRPVSPTAEFIVIDVSNPSAPAECRRVELGASANDVAVIGDYAYVASSGDELQFINIAVPCSAFLESALNLPGTSDGLSAAASPTTLLLGRGNGQLFAFDISADPTPPTYRGGISAGGAVNDISLGNSGTFAFLAAGNAAAEFQVIDIIDPALPSLVGSLNLSAALNGAAYDETLDRAFGASVSNAAEFTAIKPGN